MTQGWKVTKNEEPERKEEDENNIGERGEWW